MLALARVDRPSTAIGAFTAPATGTSTLAKDPVSVGDKAVEDARPPYLNPRLTFDPLARVLVIQVRDAGGEVEKQYPSEAQLKQYRDQATRVRPIVPAETQAAESTLPGTRPTADLPGGSDRLRTTLGTGATSGSIGTIVPDVSGVAAVRTSATPAPVPVPAAPVPVASVPAAPVPAAPVPAAPVPVAPVAVTPAPVTIDGGGGSRVAGRVLSLTV